MTNCLITSKVITIDVSPRIMSDDSRATVIDIDNNKEYSPHGEHYPREDSS